MQNPITLHVYGFFNEEEKQYQLICLETNIAISEPTLSEAENAILDAHRSYFQSFTEEEFIRGEYIRNAPFRYRVMYVLAPVLQKLIYVKNELLSYNPDTRNLRLA